MQHLTAVLGSGSQRPEAAPKICAVVRIRAHDPWREERRGWGSGYWSGNYDNASLLIVAGVYSDRPLVPSNCEVRGRRVKGTPSLSCPSLPPTEAIRSFWSIFYPLDQQISSDCPLAWKSLSAGPHSEVVELESRLNSRVTPVPLSSRAISNTSK